MPDSGYGSLFSPGFAGITPNDRAERETPDEAPKPPPPETKPKLQTKPDPCAHNAVAKWLYDNVSGEAGADAGMGPGVSGSVDLSLKEVGVDGGLGLMQFGADAHAGVDVQLAGPGVGNGFYGESQLCLHIGVGFCGTAQHQGGHSSFSLSLGVGGGISFTNALKYHQSILPPAPMPAPSGCPGMR